MVPCNGRRTTLQAPRSGARPDVRSLSVYLAGVFIGALDTSVLGPVFGLISHTFGISLSWTAWTVTAYTVAYVASTVIAGAMGDRYGRRRIFALGVLAFGVASASAALAPTFGVFLAARALQGLGAGAVYPNAMAEGVARFPQERRGVALGIFGAVFGLASIVGPNVGGALGQYLGWPSIFWVNVPLALIVLWLSTRLGQEAATSAAVEVPDWRGGIAFSAMLAAALLVFVVPGTGRWLCAVLAIALAVFFVRRQRAAVRPFLDPRALRGQGALALAAGAAVIGLDLSAAVFVPVLAQRELHLSVLGSGVALMPAAFSGAVLSGVAGVLTDRIGPRGVLQIGLGAGVAGGVLLAWPGLTLFPFILAMVALGLATAFTLGAPINRLALALYGDRDAQAGEALGLIAVCRSVGMAAGPVLLTFALALRGFGGMFGTVALASAVGTVLFFAVPDVRPPARRPGHA